MSKLSDFIEEHNEDLSGVPARQIFEEWVQYSGMTNITMQQLTKHLAQYQFTTKPKRFDTGTHRAYVAVTTTCVCPTCGAAHEKKQRKDW